MPQEAFVVNPSNRESDLSLTYPPTGTLSSDDKGMYEAVKGKLPLINSLNPLF